MICFARSRSSWSRDAGPTRRDGVADHGRLEGQLRPFPASRGRDNGRASRTRLTTSCRWPVEARPSVGDKRTVRVLAWNLLHARKDNNARLEIVARTLEAERPDVVALQEVSQSWLMNRPNRAKVLAKTTRLCVVLSSYQWNPEGWEEGLAVLARHPIVGTARRRLVGSLPRPLGGRQVLVGETRLDDGTPFAVVSVHLGFPEKGEVENLEQALDAADLVSRELLARGIPAVLIGDLNAPASALSVRALTTGEILGGDAPFVDAWAVIGSGVGITSTPTNPYTDAPEDPPQRIDYALVLQGPCPAATPVAARVIGDRPTEEGVYGSDHFGLVVDLELKRLPQRASDPAGATPARWRTICVRASRAFDRRSGRSGARPARRFGGLARLSRSTRREGLQGRRRRERFATRRW